jgi:cardiolipin synthase
MATNPTTGTKNELEETSAHSIWTLANILTLFRILLTLPFLYFVKQGRFGTALLIFFIASITDFADGYVARRFRQRSRLGRILDPLADKLLTTAGFVVMGLPNGTFDPLPLWLVFAVVGRDVIILAGSAVVFLVTRYKEFKPTILGKINTFLELGLIVVYLGFNTGGILLFLLPLCYAIVITSVVVSGVEYIAQGVRIIKSHRLVDR